MSRWPGWVLLVAGALAVASVALAYTQLHFESNRNALVDENLPWNARFIAWRSAFANTDDLVVAVDTHGPDGEPSEAAAARAHAVVDELGPQLAASEAVAEAVWGFDAAAVHPRVMRLEPIDELERRLREVVDAAVVLASPTPADLLARAMQGVGRADGDASEDVRGIERFRAMIEAFDAHLASPAGEGAAEPTDLAAQLETGDDAPRWRYLHSENGRLLLIRITPRADPDALNPYHRSITRIRDVVDAARAAHRNVELGLTGIKVIEADETAAAMRDSSIASILAVVLIAVVLITAFHSVRVPLMLIASLAVGIAWSFGFLTLAIGHLQVISVVFVVLLLGLGIAFGIHLASGFELVRHTFPDTRAGFRDALQQTLETIGPGLLTGAVTTAAAFATTMFTDFRGVAEMGLIAGAGILLCLAAMCSVYPALLRVVKPHHRHVKPMDVRRVHLFEPEWVMPFVRRPRTTLTAAAVITAISLVAITQMRFDYNLISLMPRHVDSVEWQRRLIDQGGQSVWSITSITDDLDAARERVERFRSLETVESVGGIGRLFPRQGDERRAMIDAARDEIERVAHTPAAHDDAPLLERVQALRTALALAAWGAGDELSPRLDALDRSLGSLAHTIDTLPEHERDARLAALEGDYDRWRQSVAERVDQALSPEDVQPDDLPANILAPYLGTAPGGDRLYALEVHPRLPPGVADALDPALLSRFIADIYTVDPQATGVMVQVYESGTLIWQSYLLAGACALLVVFGIVTFDFQSWRDAVLALVPVAVGFTVTFAVMYAVGLSINPANIMVLPLMFGIGVDAGVHVLHRYRQSPYHRPPGLTAGTGKGVTLTSLTTMIGFGTLMLASHRGIAGLGLVLTVGIGMTMLACWSVMPAWLELRNERLRRERWGGRAGIALPRELVES